MKGISHCLLLTLKLPRLEYIAGLAFFTRLYVILVGLNDTEFYFRSFSFFFKPFITLHNDFFFHVLGECEDAAVKEVEDFASLKRQQAETQLRLDLANRHISTLYSQVRTLSITDSR